MFNKNILTHNNYKKKKKFPLGIIIIMAIFFMSGIIVISNFNII